MEQTFQRNLFSFFLEFKQFSLFFTKTIKSFLKLSFELICLIGVLINYLWHLFFVGPSLYKWHSPYQKSQVERCSPANFPKSF